MDFGFCFLFPRKRSRSGTATGYLHLRVKSDPVAYNHKLLELTGFVEHGFEDFTFFDPHCASWPPIWLEYGGTVKSGTMYCCGVTPDRKRPDELVVENIRVPLIQDEQFETFDRLIHRSIRPDKYTPLVHAALTGRFFAGKPSQIGKGTFSGFGHMGCCSLLVIQEVKSVDGQHRDDLDYNIFNDKPDTSSEECAVKSLTSADSWQSALDSQKAADSGRNSWMFDDPKRVATEVLAQWAGEKSATNLKQLSTAAGRVDYRLKINRNETDTIIVSRPYWLSFYAHDSQRVAWVVLAAYADQCGKKKP